MAIHLSLELNGTSKFCRSQDWEKSNPYLSFDNCLPKYIRPTSNCSRLLLPSSKLGQNDDNMRYQFQLQSHLVILFRLLFATMKFMFGHNIFFVIHKILLKSFKLCWCWKKCNTLNPAYKGISSWSKGPLEMCFLAIMWVIWIERNDRVLHNRASSIDVLWDNIVYLDFLWSYASGVSKIIFCLIFSVIGELSCNCVFVGYLVLWFLINLFSYRKKGYFIGVLYAVV